jgi:hypothetical protein
MNFDFKRKPGIDDPEIGKFVAWLIGEREVRFRALPLKVHLD